MAESWKLQCETCLHEKVTNSASKWCTECEEGCYDEYDSSHKAQQIYRNHHVISTKECPTIEKLNVTLECPNCKQLDFYCHIHESCFCVCVQLKDNGCSDLMQAASGVKTSTTLLDLKQTVDGLQQNKAPIYVIDNLKLNLRTNIKMGQMNSNVTSCLILPNNCIMIASWNKPSLTILNEDGSHDRDISLPYDPYDVTMIDDQRVAVSYGFNTTGMSIININNQDTQKTLGNLCEQWILGISYNDDKLYAVVYGEGIKVIDLDGNIIKTIHIYEDACSTYKVTTQKDKIFYSVDNWSVYCVDLNGTEIWMCQDDRLQVSRSSPAIAVDSYGITFAAGYNNNLLLAISPNGKQQKVLLTSSDGLQYPNALYFDKNSKHILICNHTNGNAVLYDVIY